MPESAVAEAPVAPVAAPPPSQSAPQSGEMSDSDAYLALNEITAEPATPVTPATPAKDEGDEPAEPVTPAQPKPETKIEEKPKQIPPKDVKDGKFVKAATLRENYDRLKVEFKALQEKQQKYESEAAERAKQPNSDAHLKDLQAKYEALQKEHEANQQEMRFVNYERSQEYKDKYEKPFVDAYQLGRETVSSLRIIERKNDMDEVIQPSRPATAEDFDKIMQSNDPTGTIEQLFGSGVNAAEVNNARRDVVKANHTRLKAIEDYRKQGTEREKQMMEAQNRAKAESTELFNKTIQASKEKYKEWFAPAENDEKGNSLLSQGEALADLANGLLKPEDFPKLPQNVQEKVKAGQFGPQEMVKLHAAMRNKAMGFDRLAFRLTSAQKRIKELETELGQFKASEPKPGQGGGRTAPPQEDTMESTLETLNPLVH